MPISSAFTDQVIWITGASSGIGAALARALAAAGAQLVLSARREPELQALAATVPGGPERHLVLPLDLTATGTFPAAVETVLARFGHLDRLINNGGLGQRGDAADTPLEVDRRIMEVNYFGQVGLTKAVLPHLTTRGAGHIVVVSSVVGYVATPHRSAYAASKHALHGFYNALRAELHPTGVRVSIVCPGYVRTEISLHALDSSGGRHARMDKNQARAMSADTFAARLLPQLAAHKEEILIGGREIYAVYLQRFLPRLVSRVLRRSPKR
ncbi:SDR family oxidoreductase [Actomonas aquatica]|uniref:SDR family oxidoreductase n=1 Tax=Actomonas aquatica TaxID=2866162 RepID=A0ABZ1C5U3_9BACT|nr:SDR family oxidoreductase [Opitutus sp. WL0086]WRQ87101.1 SDR family oxidoreductase [Opitutus sp. WL0086]